MTGENATALARPTSMDDVKDRIASRIRESFVELMPEDAWGKLIEAEVARFTTDQARGYYGERRPTPLEGIIRGILEERYRKMLDVELAKPKYRGHFDEPGEFIETFIKNNIAAIVVALLGGLGQSLVEQVKRSIQDDAANRC